jgi:hypothetical protein
MEMWIAAMKKVNRFTETGSRCMVPLLIPCVQRRSNRDNIRKMAQHQRSLQPETSNSFRA